MIGFFPVVYLKSLMNRQNTDTLYDKTISQKGFRFTSQRRQVYDALLQKRDHPTAVEVFLRVKENLPNISLATVYNCLETLTACGLVRHVNLDRQSSRYCPNLEDHGHFFCDRCGSVMDVPRKKPFRLREAWEVPRHAVIAQHEVTFRGLCPDCATSERKGHS